MRIVESSYGRAREATIADVFERIAARWPSRTAVISTDEKLSFVELNRRANKAAYGLLAAGLRPGQRVGILLPRSVDALITLLAIVKSGGVWVPLDPELPESRLSFMVADAGLFGLVSRSEYTKVCSTAMIYRFLFDEISDIRAPYSEENPSRTLAPEDPAYIIYTSGSTGLPKGVLVSQASAVNMAFAHAEVLSLHENSRILQSFSFSFDASVFEVLVPLLNGAAIAMAPREAVLNPNLLSDFLRRERVTSIQLPPAVLAAVSEQCLPDVETVLVGGEVYPDDLVERWRTGRRVLNFYGPTEATVSATCHERRDGDGARIIGRPLTNVCVYILDPDGKPASDGESGEIYIGGAGVALGYLNRDELTAERFLSDPFAGSPGARMYRTGDRGRFRSDGTLEFLGRVDTQVKIRGFRIELEEVEALLKKCRGVIDAVAAVRSSGHGYDDLVGFIVPRPGYAVDFRELREELSLLCPRYMLPSRFVTLHEVPRTPNGKLDRAAVKGIDIQHERCATPESADRTPLEHRLLEVLRKVIQVDGLGMDERLIDIGVHSLVALRIVARLRETFSIDVPPSMLLDGSTIKDLARRLSQGTFSAAAHASNERGPSGQPMLSSGQESLWLLQHTHPDSPAYNVPFVIRLLGDLHIPALAAALHHLVVRHIPLRTKVIMREGKLLPLVADCDEFLLKRRDVEISTLGPHIDWFTEACDEVVRRPFNLAEEIPFRATLLRLGPREHVLVTVIHHIAADGWSFGVLSRELSHLYGALRNGENPSLPLLRAAYADFQQAERTDAFQRIIAKDLEYWKESLSGMPPAVRLPIERSRPTSRSDAGGRVPVSITRQQFQGLLELAGVSGASPFAALAALISVLLLRHGADEDVVFGTVVANRDETGWDDLIGYFANLVPIRLRASGNPSFLELLDRSRRATLSALDHRRIPFDLLVRQLNPLRTANVLPLIQVMLVFQSVDVAPLEFPDLLVEQIDIHNGTAKFDLLWEFIPAPDGSLTGWIEFSKDIFDHASIQLLARRMNRLIDSVIEHPHRGISNLVMLDAGETSQIMSVGRPRKRYSVDACIHELFEDHARQRPDAVALIYEGEQITYGSLYEKALSLSAYLDYVGVKPGMRVALCFERGPNLVASILGILMAGATYVPIDPYYPHERSQFIIEDSQAKVVVSDDRNAERFRGTSREVITWPDIAAGSYGPLEIGRSVTPQHEAYVIYTSGTTGRPKGVQVTHKNIVRLMHCARDLFDFSSDDIWTLFHSYAFDFSVWEIWGALAFGGSLVIVPHSITRAPDEFRQLLAREAVTILCQTPSAFNHLMQVEQHVGWDDRLPLRYVIFGGEAVSFPSLAPWMKKYGDHSPKLINMYGITETTVHVTFREIREQDLSLSGSFIGLPLPDLMVYLVDEHGCPVPDNVPGEIWVGGDGVSAGYLNRPELSAERFINDPFNDNGGRIYRSGDLARRHHSGDLEYLGRIDNQVKIRGFRIELDEVEACLAGHLEVQQAVVAIREGEDRSKEIWAWIMARAGTALDVRRYVSEHLPEYMIPSKIIEVDRFPLTPTGKIDKQALPNGDTAVRDNMGDRVLPATSIEKAVAEVWEAVLGIKLLGVDENFFEVGGHSLLAAKVALRLRNKLGLQIPVQSVFEEQTVATLARAIERMRVADTGPMSFDLTPDFLIKQVKLDETIDFRRARRQVASPSQRILLTGGTGFLGAYLLCELLQTFDAEIYCLVRCRSVEEGRERLLRNLTKYRLNPRGLDERIRIIPGDLGKPFLGLSESDFRSLACEIDVIYHNGAWVNFLAGYHKLFPTNVFGTHEIIRLACEGGLIPLHYISSTGVFGTPGNESVRIGRLYEHDDIHIGLETSHIGYVQTKWVAEKMVWLAKERGLPVGIFRCGMVMGDSRDGRTNVRDFPSLLIKTCIELEAVYRLHKLDNFIPVDVASRAIVHISRQPRIFDRVFHVVNPHHFEFAKLWEYVRSLGYRLEELAYEEWLERLSRQSGGPESSAIFPLLGLFVDKLPRFGRTVIELFEGQPVFDASNFLEALSGSDIVCPPVDRQLVATWISYYRERGFIPEPPASECSASLDKRSMEAV